MERIALPDAARLPSDALLGGAATDAAKDADRRRHRRLSVDLAARVILPDGAEADGRVACVSAGGARLAVRVAPTLGATVAVYAERLGRIEGRVARATRDGFVLAFPPRAARAKRLADALTWIANMGPERDRRGARRYGRSEAATLVRSNGDACACRILDISVSGASVGIDAHLRPPIGEAVTVGVMAARVVRHHEAGIGVAFATGAGTGTGVDQAALKQNERAMPAVEG